MLNQVILLNTLYIFTASLSEDDTPIRSKKQQNSSGFSDFCIKDIRLKDFGKREIEFAEQGNKQHTYRYYIS